jgi:valyl-tRNA synthetase
MMEPRYDPHGVEERWQRTWEDEGLYNADPDPTREPYVDAHPPPNVTGELHMGHALKLAIGDTMIRWKRMQGFSAGPAGLRPRASRRRTSSKVLLAEDVAPELGASVQSACGNGCTGTAADPRQFRRMGASLDYQRTRFTMDEQYVRAVMRFFVHLYDRGWIYRANRIINWCPYHGPRSPTSARARLAVDDPLPFADGDNYIAIATVRPATIPATSRRRTPRRSGTNT